MRDCLDCRIGNQSSKTQMNMNKKGYEEREYHEQYDYILFRYRLETGK